MLPDVAFLCAFRRGVEIAAGGPYLELATTYPCTGTRSRRLPTLSYFDGVNFARRIHSPSLFSVALMDTVVPPSTTFAAFNHLAAEDRSIEVYPFNDHEGGGGGPLAHPGRLAGHALRPLTPPPVTLPPSASRRSQICAKSRLAERRITAICAKSLRRELPPGTDS